MLPNTEEIADILHNLHRLAGSPRLKDVAAAADASVATVSKALRGVERPRREMGLRLIEALGGDPRHYGHLWSPRDPDRVTLRTVMDRMDALAAEVRALRAAIETNRCECTK